MKQFLIHVDDAVADEAEKLAQGRPVESVLTELLVEAVESKRVAADYDLLMSRLRTWAPLPLLSRDERNAR